MPQPATHLLHIRFTVESWQAEFLDVHLPVWSPGSYLVREYAKHLQEFTAQDDRGKPLAWQKISKNHWQIQRHPESESIQISYKIFANDLTVRTNHVDSTHSYFNGGATFMFVPQHEQHPLTVEIELPKPEWAIATALPAVEGKPNTFYAADFDTLVDSPFEIGIHTRHEFTVLGKPHTFVIWGEGNHDPKRIVQDTKILIETEAEIFGGLPYDRFLFLVHLSSGGFGGLEHKNCCTLNFNRFGFRKPDNYLRFVNLVAHEFFHTWNVKRLRPKALETFDYDRENYTPSLWFSEGTTSYYDQLVPLRAKIYDSKHFLKLLGDSITRLQTTYGRHVQSLHESSLDTWIKLYRPDANSPNTQISYYLKGELVSMLLDLLIRDKTNNQRSLDTVMQIMWQRFGKSEIGFLESELHEAIETVAGANLDEFWQSYLYGTKELDYNFYFEPFGLEVQAFATTEQLPYLGLTLKGANGVQSIKTVEANSPAYFAGISPGDELLAMNGIRVTAENLSDRLMDFAAGDRIELSLFQQDRLVHTQLTLQPTVGDRCVLTPLSHPSSSQIENLNAWLGG
ncbi:M61 family metallopeptidase [Tumidithrix helvetica PCC 7403]|uniref:M61 family metallopeptidase n=1 Tax=Tumidithrix helvetica TaxID=3457545 RepID=UPI003C827A4C